MERYPFITYATIAKYLPAMEENGVSKIARGKTDKVGFLEIYKKHGKKLPVEWSRKRNLFLVRSLAAYNKKPTERRFLSLIAWAYMPPTQVGEGLVDAIKEGYRRVKGFFTGREAGLLPPKVRSILNQHGAETVTIVEVCRVPIQKVLSILLNMLSLGQFEASIRQNDYDDMFHLYMVVTTNKGTRLLLEKNEVINLSKDVTIRPGTKCIPVTLNGRKVTLSELLDNTRQQMGDVAFTSYDPRSNNCQDFLASVVRANGMGEADTISFIKQDAEAVFKAMPEFVSKFAKAVTDIAAKADALIQGQGVKKKY